MLVDTGTYTSGGTVVNMRNTDGHGISVYIWRGREIY